VGSVINPRPPSLTPAPVAAPPPPVPAVTPAPAPSPSPPPAGAEPPALAEQEAVVARRARGRAGTVATGWTGALLEAVGIPVRKRLLGE
jgi:hypothetical protein